MVACTSDFRKALRWHAVMKAEWRSSVKDVHQSKGLKIQIMQIAVEQQRRLATSAVGAARERQDGAPGGRALPTAIGWAGHLRG